MTSLDILARFFLFFSNVYMIIPLLILGFVWGPREVFRQAIYILFFSMIVNMFLKSLFQVPLPAVLGKGFAFPSGHMQASATLYGFLFCQVTCYIACNVRKAQLGVCLTILLLGIGWGLVHFDYHNWVDVSAACGVSASLILSQHMALRKISFLKKQPHLIGFVFLCIAIPLMVDVAYRTWLPTHAWQAFYALCGASLGALLTFDSGHTTQQEKIFATGCCLAACLLVGGLSFKIFPAPQTSAHWGQMGCLLLGACPPLSIWLAKSIKRAKQKA